MLKFDNLCTRTQYLAREALVKFTSLQTTSMSANVNFANLHVLPREQLFFKSTRIRERPI